MVLAQRTSRIFRDIKSLQDDPASGYCIRVGELSEAVDQVIIEFPAPISSPYHPRRLEIKVFFPPRFPFEPPNITFITSLYHPNIDGGGRICMDLLKLPPSGGWKPTICLRALLDSIGQLLIEPNADDPLMFEIAAEYIKDRRSYIEKAKGAAINESAIHGATMDGATMHGSTMHGPTMHGSTMSVSMSVSMPASMAGSTDPTMACSSASLQPAGQAFLPAGPSKHHHSTPSLLSTKKKRSA